MARVTISISDNLRVRMDEVDDSVNWSNLAARAFETKLGEIATQKQAKSMSEVIQRLRASKLGVEDDSFKEGYTSGVNWAKDTAQYIELSYIAEIEVDPAWDENDLILYIENAIAAEATWERYYLDCFWENVFSDGVETALKDSSKLSGFIKGASSVFCEVRAHI